MDNSSRHRGSFSKKLGASSYLLELVPDFQQSSDGMKHRVHMEGFASQYQFTAKPEDANRHELFVGSHSHQWSGRDSIHERDDPSHRFPPSAMTKCRLSRSKKRQPPADPTTDPTLSKDHVIFAESPVAPGVPVVYRPPEERAANPDRLNLDRRHLTVCPILEGEEKLRLLNMQHNAITKLQHLSNLRRLVFLDLYDNLIHEISALEGLLSLRVLMLGKNRIRKITGLQTLLKLDVLDLHGNMVREIEGMSHLTHLRVLNLAGNDISCATNLSGLQVLAELNLRRNRITSIYEVDELPNLQRLFLSHNLIQSFDDICCLSNCDSLSELTLDGNPLANHHDYRHSAIFHISHLRSLDQTSVSEEERSEALAAARAEEEKLKEIKKLALMQEHKVAAIAAIRKAWESHKSSSSHSIGCSASTRSFVAHSNSGSRRIHGSANLLHSSSLPHLLPTYFVDHDGVSLHLYGNGALEVLDSPIQHTGKQKPVEEVHFHFIEFEEIAYWLTKLTQSYPHTTAGSGYWSNFFVLTNRGNLVPTRNQILLDAHFELPRGLPPDLVEILEKKLQKLDSVLEKEMEIIEDQRHRIITGELTPPTYLAGVPSYLFRDASNSHCSSATSEGILSTPTPPPPGAPLVSSSPPSPYRRHVTPTRRLIRSDQHVHRQSTDSVASDDPFASFDWQRSDFDPAGTDGGRRHRGNSVVGRTYPPTTTVNGHAYEKVDYEPTRSPPRSLSIDFLSSAADRSPRAQKLDQYKKASSFESHLEVDRNVRRPYMPVGITVEDLDRGAASAVSKSPGRRSLGVIESPARFSPRFTGRHSRDSSIGSRSEEEAIVQRTRADSSVGARERWKRAVEKQLPEIRRRMTAREKTFPGLSGNGAISLVELVDQLQGYKKMSENIFKDTPDFSALNTEFRSRSRSVIDVKRRILHKRQNLDERVRMLVFRKTMEALIYPASEPDVHQFEVWSARRPTACSECNYPLWGLTKQGVKCAKCGLICHDRCKSTVSQDCFVHDAYSAVNDKMQRMVINHANRFELLREAFNVPLKRNEDIQDEIKGSILDMVENFSGDITVKVVAAQGLLTPKSGDQRCYVTVAVGSQKKKTSTFKRTADDKNPPHWNEEFTFQCFNWHETIKIRVWNERDTAMAHMVKRLTNEGSTFLGEKIIEVRRVGPPQEVWYKLEKRSIKEQEVSGHIKLNISATIDGEEIRTPFHEQYTKLHEQLFFYCYLHNQEKLVQIPPKPPSGEEGSEVTSVQCLPPIAQEVVDEFALRYAIDPIYRMMVHIELLVNHHSLTNALTVTGNLLKNLKYQMFMHVVTDHAVRAKGASELMEEYMDASNFGRDNFSSLLDRLLTSLKLDLQQYREFYPSSDEQKLTELVDTCQLMSTVLEFQQQAMGMLGCGKLEDLVLENMKECVRSTFEFIVENSLPSRIDQDSNTHPGLSRAGEPFEFFYNLLRQMRSVIQEDRRVYAPRIKTFCPSYDFGDVSANDLWTLFSSTIEGLFDVEANLEIFEPKDYVSLLFSVKSFYEAEIKNIKGRVTQIPEYPRWFVPCVKKWLQQFQRKAVEFVDNAWEDDKVTFGFAPHEQQKFTSSTFQTFFFLNQGYELISSLQSEDQQVRYIHYEEFSRVIVEVVGHYIEKVCQHIPAYETDLGKMCMLLNNLHALRINIQDLFNVMGGEENAGAGANKILSDFQSQELRKELQAWCNFVARSMTPGVLKEIKQFQFRLLKFKGQGSIDREGHVQTDRESMKILAQPLMDYLTKQASTVADTCELVITKLVIKELWHICVEGLHRMLLPMLKYDQDGGGERSSEIEFAAHHYSTKQCYALEALAEILKDFFTAGEIVKQNTIEKGMKNLRSVIGFYRDTTEMLITGFMKEETTHPPTSDGSCGEVMLEVDAYAHTTKLDGTVRVLAASELCGVGGVASLKPSIELTVIAPKLFGSAQSRKDLRFHTASKTGSSPKFNESFKFTLQNWEFAEIQLVAKHKAVFGKDRVIGVAVIPFSSVTQDANLSVGLSPSTPLSMHCQAILNVLSVRTYDEAAKDFVALKRQQRENTTSYAEE